MQFGLVGLGKIGSRLARNALGQGHRVVGYDRDPRALAGLQPDGLVPATSLAQLVLALPAPRTVLVYVPHGPPTEAVVSELERLLEPDDLLVDGGNSHFRDSSRRHERLRTKGVAFLDVGTSGGLEGARRGACFLVGGEPAAFARLESLLRDLAVPGGVAHVGPAGAGHFVKLIHNAIEFAMLQALGEGLDLLVRSDYPLDPAQLFETFCHGSVIRGWLTELMADSLRDHRLEPLSSYVEDTREVRWALEYALEKEAWIPVIAQSELCLYRYRDLDSVAGKGVALLRHAFGGHPLHLKNDV